MLSSSPRAAKKDGWVVVDSTARGVIALKDVQSFSLVFREGSDAKTLEFKRSGTVLSSSRSGTFKETMLQADTFLLRTAQHQWRPSSIIIVFRQSSLAGACGGFNGMVISDKLKPAHHASCGLPLEITTIAWLRYAQIPRCAKMLKAAGAKSGKAYSDPTKKPPTAVAGVGNREGERCKVGEEY